MAKLKVDRQKWRDEYLKSTGEKRVIYDEIINIVLSQSITTHKALVQELELKGISKSESAIRNKLINIGIEKDDDTNVYKVTDLDLLNAYKSNVIGDLLNQAGTALYEEPCFYPIHVAEGYEELIASKLLALYSDYVIGYTTGKSTIIFTFNSLDARDTFAEILKDKAPNHFVNS